MSMQEKSDIFNVVAFVCIAGATTLVVFLTFQVLLMSCQHSVLVRGDKRIERGRDGKSLEG